MDYIIEEKVLKDIIGQPIKKGDQVVHLSVWKSSCVVVPAKVLHAGTKHFADGTSCPNTLQIQKKGMNPSWVSPDKVIKIPRR